MKLGPWLAVLVASTLVGCSMHEVSFSPDGKRVVYADNATVTVQDVAQPNRKTVIYHGASISNIRWSPDGGRILFSDDQLTDLSSDPIEIRSRARLYDLSTHRITVLPFGQVPPLAWRQDGSMIFSLRQPPLVPKAQAIKGEIPTTAVWYELSTGTIVHRTPVNGYIENVLWLADDMNVACIDNHDVYVFGRKAPRRLTRTHGVFLIGVAENTNRLLVARVQKAGSRYDWVLERIDAVSGARTSLPLPGLLKDLDKDPRRLAYPLSFSPDGKWLAVSVLRERPGHHTLRDMMLSEMGRYGIPANEARQPDQRDSTVRGTCFIVRLDGSEPKELMRSPHDQGALFEASWSPDSRRVAVSLQEFSRKKQLSDLLRIYSTDGSLVADLLKRHN